MKSSGLFVLKHNMSRSMFSVHEHAGAVFHSYLVVHINIHVNELSVKLLSIQLDHKRFSARIGH